MSNRPGSEITVTDARAAMEHLGLMQPAPIFRRPRKRRRFNLNQDPSNSIHEVLDLINTPNSAYIHPGDDLFPGGEQCASGNRDWEGNNDGEDDYDDDEDTRGVDALIEWFKGPVAAEIRRVAGVMPGPVMAPAATAAATVTAEAGLSTANGISRATAALGAPLVNTSIVTPAATMFGAGISPLAGGEAVVEIGPVTWLDGEEHLHFYKQGGG